MPEQSSQLINAALREAAAGFQVSDGAAINRALREAAGIDAPEPTAQSRQPAEPARLRQADYDVRHSEPPAGAAKLREWDRWVWSKPVVGLLDQDGRLPGETGYDREATGRGDPDNFDVTDAVLARKARWRRRDVRMREAFGDDD
jgi:hypothetical protein